MTEAPDEDHLIIHLLSVSKGQKQFAFSHSSWFHGLGALGANRGHDWDFSVSDRSGSQDSPFFRAFLSFDCWT